MFVTYYYYLLQQKKRKKTIIFIEENGSLRTILTTFDDYERGLFNIYNYIYSYSNIRLLLQHCLIEKWLSIIN